MTWNQPVCDDCWAKKRPDAPHPVRIREEYRSTERCCHCGNECRNGLYDRLDPATVTYPREDDDG